MPFVIIFVKYFNTRMRANFKSQRVQIGEINAQTEDSLLGIRVVKSFANEEMEKEKFEEGNTLFLKLKKLGYVYMGGFQSTNRFLEGMTVSYTHLPLRANTFVIAAVRVVLPWST